MDLIERGSFLEPTDLFKADSIADMLRSRSEILASIFPEGLPMVTSITVQYSLSYCMFSIYQELLVHKHQQKKICHKHSLLLPLETFFLKVL